MALRARDPRNSYPLPTRFLSLVLVVCLALLGCPVSVGGEPRAGVFDHERTAHVPFRYGMINAMGGNLMVPRVDLSIDTLLGTLEIGAFYNSATKAWTWSFDETYRGGVFTDATGAVHEDLDSLPEGAAIGGTTWVKSKPLRIKSKAGLVRHFQGGSGHLRWMYWGDTADTAAYPRLGYREEPIAGKLRIVSVKQCTSQWVCRDVFAVSYDASGQVTAIDDVAGRRAEFQWSGGELVGARDGLDVEEGRPGFRYEYDLAGRLTAITNGEGERTEIDYGGDQVVEVVDVGEGEEEGDPTLAFFYEDEVNGVYATRYWDPLGNERVYTFDGLNRLREIENVAVGETTSWTYGSTLRPTSRIDPDGTTTLYAWSGDDLLTEVQPSGNVVQYRYEPSGVDRSSEILRLFETELANPGHRPLARVEDSLGLVEERSYGASGRLVSLANGAGEAVSFEYDPEGQVSKVTMPWGSETLLWGYYWHDHPGNIQSAGSLFASQTRLFDRVGNRLEGAEIGIPEEGGVISRVYDADRNVRQVQLEGGESIAIDVRSDGRRTAVERPGGGDHLMTYDALGRLATRSERVDGQWQTTRFEHDALGRRRAVERPNGMRQELVYDAADRITMAINRRSGLTESFALMTHAGGQLVSRYDSVRGGTRWHAYDTAGRLSTVTHEDGTTTALSYDLRSRVTRRDYLDAELQPVRSVGLSYDLAGRETEVLDGISQILEHTYTDGLLSQTSYGNGLTRTFEYGPQGELLGTETLDGSGTQVESTTIDRDFEFPSGLVRMTATTVTSGGVPATSAESYELTPSGGSILVQNTRVTRWSNGSGQQEIAYDAQSNLLAEGDTTFVYNGEGNRLLSVNPLGELPIAYTHDEAGFTTSRDGKPITWTANGRIASHGSDHFEWDALAAPISCTVDGVTTFWLFDGAVIGDESGNPWKIEGDEYSIDLQAGTRLFRHHDFRGNVKFTSGDSGVVEAHYVYSPYGLDEVHGSAADKVGFAGRSEIGDLMLLGARVFDPLSGRFLSPDPMFQIVNQFGYTLGNPVWWWDPDGTQAQPNPGGGGKLSGSQGATAVSLMLGGMGLAGGGVGLGVAALIFAVIAFGFSLYGL